MKIKKFLFVARCFPTIWEVFTQKFSSNVCSWKLLLVQHDQTKSIFVLSILIAKFTVKCSLFVLSKKLSQYCDCVYPVFLTKTCGLSHGISLWDWVLGGTGRKVPNLNVISYCKASKMFQQQWQRDNSKSIGESLCNFLKILNLTSDNMFQIQWGSEHFLIKGN